MCDWPENAGCKTDQNEIPDDNDESTPSSMEESTSTEMSEIESTTSANGTLLF